MKLLISVILLIVLIPCLLPVVIQANDLTAADLNNDGYVTAEDLKMMAQDINTLAATYRGDVDNDGRVTIQDLRVVASSMIRNSTDSQNVSEEDVDALLSTVTNGQFGNAGNTENQGRGNLSRGTDNSQSRHQNRGQELLSQLNRSRNRCRVDALVSATEPPAVDVPPVTEQPPVDANIPDVSHLMNKNYRYTNNTTGSEPRFSRELNTYFSRFSQVNRIKKRNNQKLGDFSQYKQRRRKFGINFDNRQMDDIFPDFVDKKVDEIPLCESPDPSVLSQENWQRAMQTATIQDAGADTNQRVPQSNYIIRLNPDDPKDLNLQGKRNRKVVSLPEEYQRFSPVTDEVSESIKVLIDKDIQEFSDDPLLSQFLTDLEDTSKFLKSADKDGDKVVSRDEFFRHLFSPPVVLAIQEGRAKEMGLSETSMTANNFQQITNELVPVLTDQGVLSVEQSSDIAQVIQASDAPPYEPPTATGPVVAKTGVRYVSASRALNVRQGPGTSNGVILAITRNTKVTLISSQGGWYKISAVVNGETVIGWVSGAYLSTVPNGRVASTGSGSSSATGGTTGGSSSSSTTVAAVEKKPTKKLTNTAKEMTIEEEMRLIKQSRKILVSSRTITYVGNGKIIEYTYKDGLGNITKETKWVENPTTTTSKTTTTTKSTSTGTSKATSTSSTVKPPISRKPKML